VSWLIGGRFPYGVGHTRENTVFTVLDDVGYNILVSLQVLLFGLLSCTWVGVSHLELALVESTLKSVLGCWPSSGD